MTMNEMNMHGSHVVLQQMCDDWRPLERAFFKLDIVNRNCGTMRDELLRTICDIYYWLIKLNTQKKSESN